MDNLARYAKGGLIRVVILYIVPLITCTLFCILSLEVAMIKYMPISEARKKITSLDKEISYDDTISITNHGKEVYALLRWDTYESIAETLDILSDEALYDDLKKGIQQFERGELVDFDTLKQSLDVHD